MPHRTSSTRNDYERKINYDWPNTYEFYKTLIIENLPKTSHF